MKKKNDQLWLTYKTEELEQIRELNERYKAFLDRGKTERECAAQAVAMAKEAGFRDLADVIRGEEKLPAQGVFLIELQYAKGLEFDEVILPDADERTCPVSEEKRLLTRHRLYTAISRATKKITILSDGKLTPLLPGTAGSAEPGSNRRNAG